MNAISARFLRSLLDRAEKVQLLVQLPGDMMRVHMVEASTMRSLLRKDRKPAEKKPKRIKPAPAPKVEATDEGYIQRKPRVIEGFPGWLKGAAKRLGIAPQVLKDHYAAGRARCQGWYVKAHWTDQPLNNDWICRACMERKRNAKLAARGLLTTTEP